MENKENQSSTVTTNTSTKSSGGRSKLLIGCVIALIVAVISICCCLVIATLAGPSVVVNAFIDDKPLDIQVEPWSQAEIDELEESINSDIDLGIPTSMTDEELTQLLNNALAEEGNDSKIKVEIDDQDRVGMQISARIEDNQNQYLNVEFIVEFGITNGQFNEFRLHELKLGGVNIGALWSGTDLSDSINQNINSENADLQKFMDSIESLEISDGKFVIDFNETATENLNIDQTN